MDKHILRYKILKIIPIVLMLGLIGFIVYVGLSYQETQEERKKYASKIIAKRNQKPSAQQNMIEYSHFDKGKIVYHVSAARVTTLQSGMQQLEKPLFIFYDNNQKESIRVKGKHCNVSRDFNTITVFDDTVVKSVNGMTVSANVIKYDSKLQQFRTPSLARYEWKTMMGKSRGFLYRIDTERLFLPKNPEISYVNLAGENKQPIVMNGDSGMIDRKSGFAFFEGRVEVNQGNDKIKADRIEATFKPGENQLQKITAINRVRVKFARPEGKHAAPSPVQQTGTRQAPSMGNVFTAESGSAKDLDATLVELYFYEDGATVKSFHSEGDCTFVLHTYDANDKPRENRIIKADTFDAKYNSKGQMEQFHAINNVSVQLQPAGPSKKEQQDSKQTIHCKDLVADLNAATGDVKEIHFNEGFKHEQETRVVSSDSALYTAAQKKTDLIGHPAIEDATYRITADAMELYEESSGIHAKGNVKSTFVRSEGKTPMTFPFSSPSNQPVYISSDIMDWNSQKQEAVYLDKAKLWQEKNVITAAKIVINDNEKTLSAYDKVHTIFYNKKQDQTKGKKQSKQQTQTQPGAQTEKSAKGGAQTQPQTQPQTAPSKVLGDTSGNEGPISVDAGIMNYVQNDRIIHFEKTVKIVNPPTRINSDKADFFLKEKDSEFDRLYAQGNVSIAHEQKTGLGNEATFFSDEKKLILEGNPRLTETGKADVVGRVLTLFLADDRILIDGQEDGRATTAFQVEGNSTPGPP